MVVRREKFLRDDPDTERVKIILCWRGGNNGIDEVGGSPHAWSGSVGHSQAQRSKSRVGRERRAESDGFDSKS